MAIDKLNTKLDEWWEVMRNLKLDSPQEEWDKFTSYLNPDAVVNLSGMAAPPARGIADTVVEMKKLMGFWSLVERRVLAQGTDAAGKTAFCNMDNRLLILGEEVDFPETEVVTFDDQDRILEYKLYCDPTPLQPIFDKKSAAA
ncbi:putative epoxide hydrolase protein [Ilyonectria robusta]